MNGNTFEYVLSGPSYTRITYPEAREDPELNAWIHAALKHTNRRDTHKFSYLYNAWTESDFGEALQDFRKSTHALYSDSGGLQIVTRGLEASPTIKAEVFKNQGAHSDFGMSFDEIPVSIEGEKSTRLDTSNRWFDKSKFEFCARETGRNIDRQIESFLEMKSSTKPIAIIQGNCYETYMRWTELMIDEIAPSRRDYIGGIAMGAASFGHGFLEDIERAYYFTQLPFQTTHSHVHFLAVGSIERILPALIYCQTGVYSNTRVSYDSTSHASGLLYGRIFAPSHLGNYINFERTLDRTIYGVLYEKINERFGLDFTLEDLHFYLNNPSKKVIEKYGHRHDQIKVFVGGSLLSVDSFIDEMENLMVSSRDEIVGRMGGRTKKNSIYSTLYDIKTLDDFRHWQKHCSRFVPSERIASSKIESNTLDF